jgi:hypothetical protein
MNLIGLLQKTLIIKENLWSKTNYFLMTKREFGQDEAKVKATSKYFCHRYLQIDSDHESFPTDDEHWITVIYICQVSWKENIFLGSAVKLELVNVGTGDKGREESQEMVTYEGDWGRITDVVREAANVDGLIVYVGHQGRMGQYVQLGIPHDDKLENIFQFTKHCEAHGRVHGAMRCGHDQVSRGWSGKGWDREHFDLARLGGCNEVLELGGSHGLMVWLLSTTEQKCLLWDDPVKFFVERKESSALNEYRD